MGEYTTFKLITVLEFKIIQDNRYTNKIRRKKETTNACSISRKYSQFLI